MSDAETLIIRPTHDERGKFAKGNVANPGGRPRMKRWKEAIEASLSSNPTGEPNYAHIRAVSDALIIAAKAGDIQAIKEIGDRIDGKVPQALTGGDEDDKPITIQILRHADDTPS